MPGKNKLKKFRELTTFVNAFEHLDFKSSVLRNPEFGEIEMAGQWQKIYFQNENPIVLELACGDADYTLELAKRYPDKNFIAIDLKGNRLWKGASRALQQQIANTAFIRARIDFLERLFHENEVSEIWITFPDPFSKISKANRRLTSPFFLEKYRSLLKKSGIVHLKTDDLPLYEYSVLTAKEENWTIIKAHSNIYSMLKLPHHDLDIKTKYECMHLEAGRKINYLQICQ